MKRPVEEESEIELLRTDDGGTSVLHSPTSY